MSLLDLPPELFRPIIEQVIKGKGVYEASLYQRVCKAFHANIQELLIDRASRATLSVYLKDEKNAAYFCSHGDEILCKRVLRETLDRNPVVRFLRQVLDLAVEFSKQEIEHVRAEYASQICRAMLALEPKVLLERSSSTATSEKIVSESAALVVALSGIIGDSSRIGRTIRSPNHILDEGSNMFPNALCAAIATDNIGIMKAYLRYLFNAIKNDVKPKNWKLVRILARHIGKAMTVAIRLHKNIAGNILFDFFDDNEALRKSRPLRLGLWLFQDAIRNTNKALLYRAMSLDHPIGTGFPKQALPKQYTLNKHQMEFLLRSSNESVLTMLIQDGQIDPNRVFDSRTLVAAALAFRRRRMAEVLIKHGAGVNAVFGCEGVTALWHAANQCHHWDVLFLLKHGANPDIPPGERTSPIQRAEQARFSNQKTLWLLKRATTEEGLKSIKEEASENVWEIYESEYHGRFPWMDWLEAFGQVRKPT